MKRLLPCLLVLVAPLLGIGTPVHAAPPFQEPTPLASQAKADALLEECEARYNRSDFRGALEKCQAALPLYRQLSDRAGEATTLNNIGLAHHNLSDYEQALIYYRQALPIVQEIGDQAGEATTLNNIGMVYYDLSKYQQTLAYLQQAMDIVQEIGDRYVEASTLTSIGAVYYALSDYEQALSRLQQALIIWREIGDRHAEAGTLNNIGAVYERLSDYEQALAYYQQMLPIARDIGNRKGEATTLYNIGAIYYVLSDYEQALAYYQQALIIHREIGDRMGEGRTLAGIGVVYSLFDYQQALNYLQQALDIWQEIGNQAGEATTLYNIGAIYYVLSDYEQALAYYQQALDIQQEIGDRTGEVATLAGIGAVYHDFSDYEQALAYFQQALDIQQKIGDRRWEATVLNDIGAVYFALSDYQQALAYFQQALDIVQEIDHKAGEARTLNNIGEVYNDLSDYEQALAYLQRALNIKQEIGDRAGEAATLSNIGMIYRALCDYKQALAYLRQALNIEQEIGDRAGEMTTLGNLAAVYKTQGNEMQALEYALQAIAILESIHGELKIEALQTAFAASAAGYYHHTVRLLLAQGREAEAFYYTERSRARTFLTFLGNQRVDPKGSEDPDLIQREVQMRGELAALEQQLREEWSKPADQRSRQVIDHINANLEARRQEYENLLIQLQLANPEYVALVNVDPLTLEEAQALLREQAPDVALLAYFVSQEETVIFVIGPETFHVQALSATRQEVRWQVEALLAQMKAEPLLPDAWQEPTQALYKWLIAPVQEHLPPANSDSPSRLVIIPHDLLHYLPFGLLYDGENTLLDSYTPFYAPSVSSLEFIFDKRHPQADTLLAFANPDALGTSHLRYAAEEAQAVADLYKTQPLIGPEATEGRFKVQAGEYGLVHLAAHSDYNPHSPLFSAILLQADESEDGRLETHEVFNLDLPQTDLVVLSACQTHLGELSKGDEVVGLERAFVRAGSPSLLTTLWLVDDAATAKLMEQFYTHLRAGVPKAEALRLAQLETQAEHPEPYYWAGFVLVGDPGMAEEAAGTPEPTSAEDQGGRGLCGGAAVLLGAIGVYSWRRWRLWPGVGRIGQEGGVIR